ncbi:MAG TPA: hypothetical protein VHE61_03805 [Opitutaceae bacterium]|nr:hypothetical protein [Opitutaceae bacterium]
MNATTDLAGLEGKIVLVCSARDHRNPPTGMRGTLRVGSEPSSRRPVVQIELEFPQMFSTRAHHRVITLDDAEVGQLLHSAHDGAYTVTLPGRLDPQAPAGNE